MKIGNSVCHSTRTKVSVQVRAFISDLVLNSTNGHVWHSARWSVSISVVNSINTINNQI